MNRIQLDRLPARAELLALYSAVGWATYTTEPDRLELALHQSLRVATAWEGESLVWLQV